MGVMFLIRTQAPMENQFALYISYPPHTPHPGISNPSVGEYEYFLYLLLSSKAKLCCFCQILFRISTLHIINEILQTAGMKKF